MNIEGSPRTVIAIPIRLGNVSVLKSYNCAWLCSGTTHHFPLGVTTIGAAVLFVVLDITLVVRLSLCLRLVVAEGRH